MLNVAPQNPTLSIMVPLKQAITTATASISNESSDP